MSNALIIIDANYRGEKIVVQANGRIAVLGTGNNVATVYRFYASGSADTSIGYGGMKSLTGYQPNYAREIATFSNLLYIGLTNSDYTSPVILKFNSNGTRDMSFGSSGELFPGSYMVYSIAVEPATGNLLVGGKRWSTSAYGLERFLPTGQIDPTFEHYDTTYQGAPGVYPTELIRLASGEFILNEIWNPISIFPPITSGSNLVRFTSNGSYISRVNYIPAEDTSPRSGPCPDILAQQSNGRILARGVHRDKIYRFSTSYATIQTISCDSYASLEGRTPAVLQSDDKMIGAGRYNGNIAIARTLP